MSCIFCFAEWPHEITEECDDFDSGDRSDSSESLQRPDDSFLSDGSEQDSLGDRAEGMGTDTLSIKRPVGRPPKESGEDMSDVLSTGRKRAVKAAPISPGMVCEWSRLEKAGGGVEPIQGCPGFPAEAVHHGPDKSVLNNDLGTNLHRICSKCHNRWHEANNKYYVEPRPENGEPWLPSVEWSPHDPSGKRMSMGAALMLEATRQQEDRRGK